MKRLKIYENTKTFWFQWKILNLIKTILIWSNLKWINISDTQASSWVRKLFD